MTDDAPGEKWLVVITKEQTPTVRVFTDEAEARVYFDRWSAQWSDCYLARVLTGPGPGYDEDRRKTGSAVLAACGAEQEEIAERKAAAEYQEAQNEDLANERAKRRRVRE